MNRIEQNIKLTEEKYERFLQNKMQDPGVEKFYKIISRIKPFVTRLDDPYILDIGCRAGIFFDILKEIGYNNFFGTELSNKWLEIVRNKGYEAVISDIQEEYLNMKFDMIFMCHVLEHTQYPDKALKNVYHMLNKSGLLYIEVPRREKGNDKDPSHFYQFNNFEKLNSFLDGLELLWSQDDFPIIGIYRKRS